VVPEVTGQNVLGDTSGTDAENFRAGQWNFDLSPKAEQSGSQEIPSAIDSLTGMPVSDSQVSITAPELQVRSPLAQPVDEQQLNRNKHFFGDKTLRDFDSAQISNEQLLGKGGFGEVHAGRIDNREVVVKVGLGQAGRSEMASELAKSEELRAAVERQVANPETDFARLQGFGGVVTVLGMGPDVSIIQERIQGENLWNSLLNTSIANPHYTADGFPKDLTKAKQMALEFAAEMMSVHAAGQVHCDIKPDNIMVDQEGHAHIIDMGGLRKKGEKGMGAHSRNGGPEYTGPECTKMMKMNAINEEMKRLNEQLIEGKLTLSPDEKQKIRNEVSALRGGMQKLQQELNELNEFEINPSYDIFSEGNVLLGLWFGGEGIKMEGLEMLYNGPTRYLQETADMDYEERTEYFKKKFAGCNEQMLAATGQQYSPEEIDKMSSLAAWMMDPEPSHRPTS
jgi:serine/threonine protein kinase